MGEWPILKEIGFIVVQDQKTAGTAAGAATSGSWQTRVLNTEVVDTNNDCSLASNQLTLSAGTYRVVASAPAYRVGDHQARLRNVTDSVTLVVGTSEYAAPTGSDSPQTRSMIDGQFTIVSSKAIELQHQFGTTSATRGLGVEANFGEVEVYATITLRRVA